MNRVKLFLGHVHAARVVRALAVSGEPDGTQFNKIKAALAQDSGPTPAPSVLTKTLRRLIAAGVVAKSASGRYSLATNYDSRVGKLADLACTMESERPE